jgi:predicted porin
LFWEQAGSNTVGQLNQTLGSMLAPTSAGAFFDNGTTGTSVADLAAYTIRTTNTINFRSERMSGVMVKASYSQSNQTSNQTAQAGGYAGGISDQTGYQVAFDWNIAKANIQASYANFQSQNPYGSGILTTATATGNSTSIGQVNGWGNGLQGTNAKDQQTLITASYDFGILKAFAGWTDRKVTSGLDANQFAKRTGQEIGVRSFITPKVEGWASAGNGRYTAFGASNPTANITGYQLGSNYWLSKRSNLYAIYGQNGTSSTTVSPAMNLSQYSIGMRHTF